MTKPCGLVQKSPGAEKLLKACYEGRSDYDSLFRSTSEHMQQCVSCRIYFYKVFLSTLIQFVGNKKPAVWALRQVGYSYSEISSLLNIPVSTVKKRIFEVRKNWVIKVYRTFNTEMDRSYFDKTRI